MAWHQITVSLRARPRGFHLATHELEQAILPQLSDLKVGLAHFFIQHTSASLTINENADPTVRTDFESHFNHMIPERAPYYEHTLEGPDDMPAHLKSSILGAGITIPIKNGQLALGTWQGIYLCEHRNRAGSRDVVITLQGE